MELVTFKKVQTRQRIFTQVQPILFGSHRAREKCIILPAATYDIRNTRGSCIQILSARLSANANEMVFLWFPSVERTRCFSRMQIAPQRERWHLGRKHKRWHGKLKNYRCPHEGKNV